MKPKVKLIGENGNVFNIIGLCQRALRKAGMQKEASEFVDKAFNTGSYNEVLILAQTYCEVE